jgi:hypothetical protein
MTSKAIRRSWLATLKHGQNISYMDAEITGSYFEETPARAVVPEPPQPEPPLAAAAPAGGRGAEAPRAGGRREKGLVE